MLSFSHFMAGLRIRVVVDGDCHGAMLGLDPTDRGKLKVLSEELGTLRR